MTNQLNTQPLIESTQDNLRQTYKSESHLIKIVLNIGLAAVFNGYAIGYFTTINFDDTMRIFELSSHRSLLLGLLTFCIPVGGGIGSLLSFYVVNVCSRRQFLIKINILAFIATLSLQIKFIQILIIFRFIQGLCLGFYSSIASTYIKQFVPLELAGRLGIFYQLGFAFALTFCFIFGFLLDLFLQPEQYWRIIYLLPIISISIQTYNLLYVYPYETPKYLLMKGQVQNARNLLKMIYKEQFVQSIFEQMNKSIKAHSRVLEPLMEMHQIQMNDKKYSKGHLDELINKTQVDKNEDLMNENPLPKMVALHLSILQQFVGIQAVIVYGGEITLALYPSLQRILPIFIHLEGFLCVIASYYLAGISGRKFMLQLGALGCGTFCIIIGIAFITRQTTLQDNNFIPNIIIIIFMFLFRGLFSLTLGPVIWIYLAQIVKPSFVAISSMTLWLSAGLVTFLFPIIREMVAGNPGLIFIGFGCYSILSFLLNIYFLIETNHKHQYQVIEEYQRKWQNLKKLKLY